MKIGIDCRFGNSPTGLGTYTREIVRSLLKRGDPVEYVLFVQSEGEEWLKGISNGSTRLTRTVEYRISECSHYSIKEQLLFPRIIRKSKVELMFFPHFNIPLLCSVPFVVTIHDLILHKYPNQASVVKRMAYRLLMKHAVSKAKKIIAVSDFTASEIRSSYGERDITVITEGVNPLFERKSDCSDVLRTYDLQKPFFLYIGNAKEHKNVQTLIDAYRKLNDQSVELVLVCTGKEVGRLKPVDGVRIIPGTEVAELPSLYSSARAFVTASLYEGFCLPVLEARACGCPVIASSRGAIPEAAGGEALLIEPTVEAFASAMKLPPALVEPSSSLPTWDEAASKTFEALFISN